MNAWQARKTTPIDQDIIPDAVYYLLRGVGLVGKSFPEGKQARSEVQGGPCQDHMHSTLEPQGLGFL